MKSYIAYYRVSTQKQGASGLGLEAQRRIVEATAKSGLVIAEYTDIESGRKNDRPELLTIAGRPAQRCSSPNWTGCRATSPLSQT